MSDHYHSDQDENLPSERREWGRLMSLSPVGAGSDGANKSEGAAQSLSRAASDEWELLTHSKHASPCGSRAESVNVHEGAHADEVQVRLEPDEEAVRMQITPVASAAHSPMESPREGSTDDGQASDDAASQAQEQDSASMAAAPASAASAAASIAPSAAPGSGSRTPSSRSFEHLSDHFAPPSSCGEAVFPSPPSLPDLDALRKSPSSPRSPVSQATPMDLSFADQLQGPLAAAAAAALASGGNSTHSSMDSLAAATACHGASPLGSSYADLAPPAASWEMPKGLQQALATLEGQASNEEHADEYEDGGAEADDEEEGGQEIYAAPPVGSSNVQTPRVGFYDSLKSFLASCLPTAAFASTWSQLQDLMEAAQMHLPALPPQLARPAAYMRKHLHNVNWMGVALGASMAGMAILSALLYNSHSNNRKLRMVLGRKETDMLQLISKVVTMQREMLRPRNVPIVRHTASVCSFPTMDII